MRGRLEFVGSRDYTVAIGDHAPEMLLLGTLQSIMLPTTSDVEFKYGRVGIRANVSLKKLIILLLNIIIIIYISLYKFILVTIS